jgi:diguanylate cyclase (GGDEF)-like protein/PAS domain S-box-containing protein
MYLNKQLNIEQQKRFGGGKWAKLAYSIPHRCLKCLEAVEMPSATCRFKVMHTTGLAREPHPSRGPDTEAKTSKQDEANMSANAATPRPFRERRRARPLDESRHEALASVNQLLVRYEQTIHRLGEAEEKYRAIFDDALVGMFHISPKGRPLSLNRKMAQFYGYDNPQHFLAQVSNVADHLLVETKQLKAWKCAIEEGGMATGIEAKAHCLDGSTKWLSLNIRAVRNENGKVIHFEGTAEDITERKTAEERIQFLAYYDALTGLPNRTLFDQQFADVLTAMRKEKKCAAVLLFEFARFKIMNDSFGHSFGDRLLRETADRLRRSVGEKDIVARVGGGEFAIVLTNIENARTAMATAQRVIAEMNAKFSIMGHSMNISFNIGTSIFPSHGTTPETLMQNADVALYSAKQEGPNEARLFTEEMNLPIMEQLMLEHGLGMALDRNELFLVYQPQVDIRTKTITGLEALLRWQHPKLGLVPPAKFIGIAEHSGLIVPIGEWVLRSACTQAKIWQEAGLPAVPIAVNVSAVQFRQQGFPDLVRKVLLDTRLDPKYLELELTESLLLTNADVMFSILQDLREMGVKLAIDDFGTGYSSLSYLRQFQVNRLKIDRSFVQDVANNSDDAAITTAIIKMAKALNLEVMAEGVETEAQMAFLRAAQCFDVQGYYFSKPVAVATVVEQLLCASIEPAASLLPN